MSDSDDLRRRIAEIDAMFAAATCWGSWMVMAGNERKALVNRLARDHGIQVEHQYVPMTDGGFPVS